jgi:hypothetical protein
VAIGPLWAGMAALTAETLLLAHAESMLAPPLPNLSYAFFEDPVGLFLCARGFRLASACS